MKVLVVGGGGREHALCWKLRRSPAITRLFCAPGNAGTARVADNVDIPPTRIPDLLRFARLERIDLTVVGPEQPLIDGLADAFAEEGRRVFGPSREAAALEGSKAFCKDLLLKYGVPTARFSVFDSAPAALAYIRSSGLPIVIKADGPAQGKGVVVARTFGEAEQAVRAMMVERAFGASGAKVVIEDFLTGPEVSVMSVCDEKTICLLEAAQDHKRLYDGDAGPNTGGMGAYSPVPVLTPEDLRRIESRILVPVVHAMGRERKPFRGLLYAGLILTPAGPRVLEFNVRFGDPEAQAVLVRMESDLLPVLDAAAAGRLSEVADSPIRWTPRASVCVVMCSGGYPGPVEKGIPIEGIDDAAALPDVVIFEAGTAMQNGRRVTSGGRVLGVTALGDTLAAARERAYEAVGKIRFARAHYRKDIASRAAKSA